MFLEDRKTRLATYKGFQEAVVAACGVVEMMMKDHGLIPKMITRISTCYMRGRCFLQGSGRRL
ncbi:MAG: hypothetical protein D6808_06570 [Candidatus Dadabacteria bacterium]|nr:MAG: hypothetical protein D6808_06570 [Candidatus Dadabacteria bacterium]